MCQVCVCVVCVCVCVCVCVEEYCKMPVTVDVHKPIAPHLLSYRRVP